MLTVTEALQQRITTRAFLATPLPQSLVHEILATARWAPSGGNTQPWKVVVLAGARALEAKQLAQGLLKSNPALDESGAQPIYPANLWEPYRTRRYQIGEDMYATMGIGRDNKPARLAHVARNFAGFGAPVLMFMVIDRRMGHCQWAHLGMFMQSICLAALERGVATCMQEVWSRVRVSMHRHLQLPEEEMIYCGISLGYADPAAPVNSLRSRRAPVEEIARFAGF